MRPPLSVPDTVTTWTTRSPSMINSSCVNRASLSALKKARMTDAIASRPRCVTASGVFDVVRVCRFQALIEEINDLVARHDSSFGCGIVARNVPPQTARKKGLVNRARGCAFQGHITHGRRDDAPPVREDFHSQADSDPANLEQRAATAGAIDPRRRGLWKECAAANDRRRAFRDENPIARIVRAYDERRQRLDVT